MKQAQYSPIVLLKWLSHCMPLIKVTWMILRINKIGSFEANQLITWNNSEEKKFDRGKTSTYNDEVEATIKSDY
jgi:hypothetical protein